MGYYNRQWAKTRRALGIKAVLGRMIDLRKKNCSVHCATDNGMIIIVREKLDNDLKIIELDQLLIPSN